MKKVLSVFFVIVFFIGCGGGSGTPNSDLNEKSKTPTTKPKKSQKEIEAEKVARFKEGKTVAQLVTGVYDLQIGDAVAFDEEAQKMLPAEPCEYYSKPGFRGDIKKISDKRGHWQLVHPDYAINAGLSPELNYCSQGLYKLKIWNGNITPEEYVEYNTTASFWVDSDKQGNEFLYWIQVYNSNFNGTEYLRSVNYGPGYILRTGKGTDFNNRSYAGPSKVLSEKIADYKVKKNNHLGLKEGMVIKDCLYTVVESSDSITSNHDQFTIIKSVVCGEGYGLMEIEVKPKQ